MDQQNQVTQQMPQQMPQQPVQPQMPIAKQAKPMDMNMIIKIARIAAGVLVMLSVFVPYIKLKAYGVSSTTAIWDDYKFLGFVLIVLGGLSIATAFIKKHKEISYITAGAVLYKVVEVFSAWIALESSYREYTHLYFGFFMMFIASASIIAANIYEDLDDIKSIFSSLSKPAVQPVVAPVAPMQQVTPVTPVVQNAPVTCAKCGAAKVGEEKFCMSCGNQF